MSEYNCIVVLGPTASGKTKLACRLASELNGAVISADSRQVYKGLDIGTGKDLEEYVVNGHQIPFYLINIREPQQQFYLHEFMEECDKAFGEIRSNGKLPIICGGTGLYLDSLRKDFSFTQIKENPELRAELDKLSKDELTGKLMLYPERLRTHADLNSRKRLIRAIEVAMYMNEQVENPEHRQKPYAPFYIGVDVSAEQRKQLIAERLLRRINHGLIEEVESLHKSGLGYERLEFLGLEYKMVSFYLQDKLTKTELIRRLQTAIQQFSKRQMTWFRKMEKEGVKIHWVKRTGMEDLIEELKKIFNPSFSRKFS